MRKTHFELQKEIADMLRDDHYFVLENMCYPSTKHPYGEIDIIGFKGSEIELWEIKSKPRYLNKAIEQLLREEKYLKPPCEKYVYDGMRIYYLEGR